MNKIPFQAPIVERSLLSWVFSVKTSLQVLLFSIILINVFVRVIPLEMQKRIVNEAISLSKIRLLFIYSGIYLVAVLGSNGFKFLINIFQTSIGQRAGAEMRKELYHRILTNPRHGYSTCSKHDGRGKAASSPWVTAWISLKTTTKSPL